MTMGHYIYRVCIVVNSRVLVNTTPPTIKTVMYYCIYVYIVVIGVYILYHACAVQSMILFL